MLSSCIWTDFLGDRVVLSQLLLYLVIILVLLHSVGKRIICSCKVGRMQDIYALKGLSEVATVQHKVTFCSGFKHSHWENWNKTKERLADFPFQNDVRDTNASDIFCLSIDGLWLGLPSGRAPWVCPLKMYCETLTSCRLLLSFSAAPFSSLWELWSCDREKESWIPVGEQWDVGKAPIRHFCQQYTAFSSAESRRALAALEQCGG